MAELSVIILAAGKGKRMHSDVPKVLHPLGGEPLLAHVIRVARDLGAHQVRVVYGHGGELLLERLSQLSVQWVEQDPPLGTGHAVAQAMPQVPDEAALDSMRHGGMGGALPGGMPGMGGGLTGLPGMGKGPKIKK